MEQTLPILTLFVYVLAFLLVNYYASPGTPIIIRLLATISFWLGFMGIVLLPIDLSRTIHYDISGTDGSNDVNDIAVNSTYVPWLATYWSTFFLAWLVLPFVRVVLYSGYFTLTQRLKKAFKTFLKSSLINLVILLVCVVVLAIYLKSVHVVPVLMAIGNTYGLLLVALLLGYGLVDVPRRMWRKSMPELELRRSQIMANVADEGLFEAVWELQDCEHAIDEAIKLVKNSNQNTESTSLESFQLDPCIAELTRLRNLTAVLDTELQDRRANSPHQSRSNPSSGGGYNDGENGGENKGDSAPSIDDLAILCARLKLAQANLVSAEQKWNLILEENAMYSSIVNKEIPIPQREDLPLTATFIDKIWSRIQYSNKCLYYVWMNYLRCLTYRVLGFTAACFSGIVLWSETTMAIPFKLSPFAFVLRIFNEDGFESGIFFKISALIPLLYMSACVYTSLFKVSFFGPNCLRGSKQSPGVALLFNAQYLIRMQFPLGYNYLNLLKIDTSSSNCAFSRVMSDMSTVPFFGTSFTVYAPLLILGLCYFTLMNGYPRMLSMLGIGHEDAILLGDRETLDNQVNEGIVLLSRNQRRQENKPVDSEKDDSNYGVV